MDSSNYTALKVMLKEYTQDLFSESPYISVFRKILSKYESSNSAKMNVSRIPSAPDPNIDIPILIAENSNTSIVLTIKSIIIKTLVNNYDIENTSETIKKHLELFDEIEMNSVVAYAISVSNNQLVSSVDAARDILSKTDYSNIKDSINEYGFNLQFFTSSSLPLATAQSISYSTNTDLIQHKSFLNSILTIIVGGINFVNGRFAESEMNKVNKLSDIYNKKEMGKILEEYYEPLQSN